MVWKMGKTWENFGKDRKEGRTQIRSGDSTDVSSIPITKT